MGKHSAKLIAWTPRLDEALTNLVKGTGRTTLHGSNPPNSKQRLQAAFPSNSPYSGMFRVFVFHDGSHWKIRVVNGSTYQSDTYSQEHIAGLVHAGMNVPGSVTVSDRTAV